MITVLQYNHYMKEINILLPIFDEEDNIEFIFSKISNAVKDLNYLFLVTLVDDGSKDGSWNIIRNLKDENINFKKIKLSRNFGHQSAIFAGLQYNKSDAVIIMDADFQDDPKYIPNFIKKWEDGFQIVLGKRTDRDEGRLRKFVINIFFKIQKSISNINIPENVGHYSLLDKIVVDELNLMPEKKKFLLGLRSFVGFKSTEINIVKNKRRSGESISYRGLFGYSINGLLSFSSLPLKLIGFIGILISTGSLLFSFVTLYLRVVLGVSLFDWDFGLTSIYFLSGIQLFAMSVLGQYISKIFDEVRGRPSFIIDKIID